MKKCKRCNADFEPKNPKGKFCSDKCRVYWSREKLIEEPANAQIPTIFQNTIESTSQKKAPPESPKNESNPDSSVLEQIKAYETEISLLPTPNAGIGKKLRESLEKKIHNLKYPKP